MTVSVHEYLELDVDARTIACSECGTELCDASENYKEHAAMRTGPVTDAGPVYAAPAEIYDDPPSMEFRQFFCPNCATLFDYELAPEDEPILHDVDLDVDAMVER
jgi:acetone carboxylase gamma subunit